MATSSSYNFTQTKYDLILDAFQIVGEYGIGRTLEAEDLSFASNLLNKMIKAWSAQGLHLWAKEEAILFTEQYQSRYILSNDSTAAKWANIDDTAVFQTTLSAVAGASQIALNDVTDLSIGSFIGIVLDNGATQWTTVAGVAGSAIGLVTVLEDSVAQGNLVYFLQNRAYKPSRIYDCRRIGGIDLGVTSTVTEVWLKALAYQDYMRMSSKTVNGVPSAYMYNPDDTRGEFYLWQRPMDTTQRIQFTYERLIQDLDTAGQNFDFPSEWLETITYQLAWRLCTPYGKPERGQELIAVASLMLENLKDWDAEITSLKIKPNLEWPEYG